MKARPTFRSLLSILTTFVFAVCCTKLEDGGDTFPAVGEAGKTSNTQGGTGAVTGGASAGGSASGSPVMPGSAGSNDGGASCTDPDGFKGVGCYLCAPKDVETLESACTDATCTPFDNALRLPLVQGGGLPELPAPSAGGTGGAGGTSGTAGSAGTGGGGGAGFMPIGVDCATLAQTGTVVYVTGSTAVKDFLKAVAQQLATQNVFVVYTGTGSCAGVDAVVNGTLMKTGPAPLQPSATYWDSPASADKFCDLDHDGVTADLGISDVFAPSCTGFETVNVEALKIRDAHGPIQTMTFVVPANSVYHEISQQAAYLVFGLGKNGGVLDPTGQQPIWNDEERILQRSASSGTQAMLAAAIGVPAGRWRGKPNKGSGDVASALQKAVADQAIANASIGILGIDYIDANNLRPQLHMLAYQDSNQPCAVFPDSTDSAKDKRNVRDGHYPIWGPLHLFYKQDSKGNPLNPTTRQQVLDIVGYLGGTKPLPNNVRLLDTYATKGLIPECAMRVKRRADGGPIEPSTPDSPCSCLYDKAIGHTDCPTCTTQGECKNGTICSQGYCEQL